jgi:hypothetical protein
MQRTCLRLFWLLVVVCIQTDFISVRSERGTSRRWRQAAPYLGAAREV